MLSGREAPGMGITCGDLARCQARQTTCGLTLRASATCWNGAKRSPRVAADSIPPSGLHGRNAMPSSSHSWSSGSLLRNAGENWFCTEARRPPVSYTHLRAHETRHDLVCRLLLEKKKT